MGQLVCKVEEGVQQPDIGGESSRAVSLSECYRPPNNLQTNCGPSCTGKVSEWFKSGFVYILDGILEYRGMRSSFLFETNRSAQKTCRTNHLVQFGAGVPLEKCSHLASARSQYVVGSIVSSATFVLVSDINTYYVLWPFPIRFPSSKPTISFRQVQFPASSQA